MTTTENHVRLVQPLRSTIIGMHVVGVVLLTGCTSTISTRSVPSPPPQLLHSAELAIPHDCSPPRGAIYRTRFMVQPDGRVLEATSESGDGCVQQALREWVSSFRYTSVPDAMPMVIDWLEVTASRGG